MMWTSGRQVGNLQLTLTTSVYIALDAKQQKTIAHTLSLTFFLTSSFTSYRPNRSTVVNSKGLAGFVRSSGRSAMTCRHFLPLAFLLVTQLSTTFLASFYPFTTKALFLILRSIPAISSWFAVWASWARSVDIQASYGMTGAVIYSELFLHTPKVLILSP